MSMSAKRSRMYMEGKAWAKGLILLKEADLGMVKDLAQQYAEKGTWNDKQFGAGALAGCCEIEVQREKGNG